MSLISQTVLKYGTLEQVVALAEEKQMSYSVSGFPHKSCPRCILFLNRWLLESAVILIEWIGS